MYFVKSTQTNEDGLSGVKCQVFRPATNNVTDDEPVNSNSNFDSSATPTSTTTSTTITATTAIAVTRTPPTPPFVATPALQISGQGRHRLSELLEVKKESASGPIYLEESSSSPSSTTPGEGGESSSGPLSLGVEGAKASYSITPTPGAASTMTESLKDDDDDDDSEALRPRAFAVSQDHVTHQHKGILTFATSTPHASTTTGESSSSGRLSKTVDSYYANDIVQKAEDVQKTQEREPFFKSRLCRWMAVVFLVIAIGVAPSPAPTPAPTSGERLRELVEFLAPISERELLEDPSTPQSKAVRWLANTDQADLDIDTMDNKVVLQERYLMALLYYSFESRDHLESLDFLKESSVCSWNNGGDFSGIYCENGGHVFAIKFCK
jgi:hypothetical protein